MQAERMFRYQPQGALEELLLRWTSEKEEVHCHWQLQILYLSREEAKRAADNEHPPACELTGQEDVHVRYFSGFAVFRIATAMPVALLSSRLQFQRPLRMCYR